MEETPDKPTGGWIRWFHPRIIQTTAVLVSPFLELTRFESKTLGVKKNVGIPKAFKLGAFFQKTWQLVFRWFCFVSGGFGGGIFSFVDSFSSVFVTPDQRHSSIGLKGLDFEARWQVCFKKLRVFRYL